MPRISIVTPSFNQAGFLAETLGSVICQNYPNLEYVVIDGASTDGSQAIIGRHAESIAHWVSEKDSGHADALNKGFAKTSGEVMAWINSDDKYTPWSFATVAEIFAAFPHVEWISGLNSLWNVRGAMTSSLRQPKNVFDFLLGRYAWVQQESVFWRRSLWDKAGGYINSDYRFMVDGELWTRFFQHADLYSVDCILGGFRVQPANRSGANMAACHAEMERAILAMRQTCSTDILNIARQLRRASRLQGMSRHLGAVSQRLSGSALQRAAYHNIFFNGEAWAERRIPFSL